jgi:long-chain acyl-CoA synthetase
VTGSVLLQHDFERWVADDPDRVALICGHERHTYRDVAERAAGVATALRGEGVRRGDRVALFLDNGVDFVAGLLAALGLGAVFMPINPSTKREKLGYMLADARATALLTHASLAHVWRPAVAASPTVTSVHVVGRAEGADDGALAWPDPERAAATGAIEAATDPGTIDQDLAAIIYTSGSTGLPKGVMLSHLNMISAARSVSTYLGMRGDDIILCALPLSFDYGLYQVLMAFRVGASVVVERNFSFPVTALESMARERVTIFPGVPTMFAMLTTLPSLGSYDLGALRMITNTAAALSETQIRRLRGLFPAAELFSMYGLTECQRVSYLPPGQLDLRPTSVGRGMPNEEVWLVDDEGRRLPDGATGELVIRGSHVMRGYWEKPDETAARLRPGPNPGELVLYSGDLFRTDAEGWLYFIARRDDIIKSRGEKVSPREVENAIASLEGVLEVAVIGVPDPVLGEAIKAFITVVPGTRLSERDVIRHCLAHLEHFMAPGYVEFVESLPMTGTGKISRSGLA